MGQKISQTKNTLDINVYLNKYYPNYTIKKTLNNGMLNKTVLLLNEGDKCPLVAKIFFKSDFDLEEYRLQVEKIKESQKKIIKESLHNVIPLIYMEENSRSGIIFRQYIEYNLKERIYLMPYLNNIQKIWITFQILYAVNELSELGIIHGDLKPENILLTSNLSVYLCDIATYKPSYISMDDIGSYTYFYGTNKSDSLKGCYFAPERLLDKGESSGDNAKTLSMDVFSVGVIIAELFLEKNVFDFPQLLNYKKKNNKFFNIEENLIKIPENIRNLIKDMIEIDPLKRITIKEALNRFSKEVCPLTMTGFLLHFNTIINSTVFWKPDLIIGFIYRYWISLWKMIFGPDDTPAILYQNLNLAIINKIILENPLIQNYFSGKFSKNEDSEYLYLNNYKLFFDPDSGVINENGINELKENHNKNNNKECVFIIMNLLLQNMQYTKYDSSNLVALEMVKNLSYKLDDITKLKLIIPYFVENLKRDSYNTKLVTLNYLFEILYSFNYKELILPVTEYNYFDSYIFPAILEVYKLENHELVLEFFNNIDKIIDIQQKFLNLTLKAKLLKISQLNSNTRARESIGEIKLDNIYEENEFQKELMKIKKDRRDEIFKDYDNSVEEFKASLFRVINDIIGEINDIDIVICVIRKLPHLFIFYGKSKTMDFSKFIINNFNKTDWIIQKEILCHIPKMMTTLGENALNDYILPCMEMLIDNNSNEQKTYELIKSVHQLLKMEYLSPKKSVELFNKLLPFLIHPNLNIKNEIINFIESLISFLSPEEAFAYLYEPLSDYIKIPPLLPLTEGVIKKYSIERLNRICYQLQFRKKDESNNTTINEKYKNNELDNKLETEFKIQLNLFKSLLEKQKSGNNNDCHNGEINYSYKGSKDIDPLEYLDKFPKHNLKGPIEKYIKKEFANLNDESAKKALLHKVVFKIFYLTDSTDKYSFPYIKDNRNCSFKIGNNILNSELFNIFYILKTLSLSIKSENVNELLYQGKNSRSITGYHILVNYMCNKSFHNWRPQGQIITTLYDHDKNQIEKLLPLPDNKFCSFDNEGCANIFKITKKESDDSIIVKKLWYSGNEIECPIKYGNTIAMIDNLFFLAASENKIYKYNPLYSKDTRLIFSSFCESSDNSNITCVKAFGKNSLENQKIIMGTEKGGINIFDQRIKKVAISNNIPISHGMISCISEGYTNNLFLVGTIGGHLLEYDMRLNSIVKDYTYCENIPILGIFPYRLTKNSNYDLSSILKSNNYYAIWTGAFDHEIGLWNSINMHCDLLLKVNTLENRKELRPLTVEIPYLTTDNNLSTKEFINKRKKFKKELNSIIKFTHRYNNNFTKSLLLSNLGDKLNENSYDIFSNMTNLYDNPSTVQCVVSPYCESNFISKKDIEYDNCSYLLSAGNDMTIRYWDITREGLNNTEKKSYLINAPNNLTYCNFTKSNFDKTNILQSNEAFNEPGQRTDMPGFSPYLNYNGVSLHYIPQNEFEGDISNLKFCSRISDPSHKSIITDLLPLSIETGREQLNILASCSWDGKIKIWK